MYPSLIFSVLKTLCLLFRINTITTLRPRVWIYGWRKSNKVSLLLLTWLPRPLSVSVFRSISKSGLNIRISAYQCPGIRVMRFLWVHVNTVSPIVIITRIRIQSGSPFKCRRSGGICFQLRLKSEPGSVMLVRCLHSFAPTLHCWNEWGHVAAELPRHDWKNAKKKKSDSPCGFKY